jgi:hypothetical protein
VQARVAFFVGRVFSPHPKSLSKGEGLAQQGVAISTMILGDSFKSIFKEDGTCQVNTYLGISTL